MFANTVEKDHLRCENLTPYSEWISTLQYTEITYKNYPFPQLIITVGVKVLQDTIIFFLLFELLFTYESGPFAFGWFILNSHNIRKMVKGATFKSKLLTPRHKSPSFYSIYFVMLLVFSTELKAFVITAFRIQWD